MASHNGTTESDFGLERRIEDIDLKDGDEVTNSIKIPKLKESLWDITNVLGYTGYCSNVDDINDVHGVYVDRPTMDILWQQAVRKAFKKRDYAQYTPAKAEALHFATIYQMSDNNAEKHWQKRRVFADKRSITNFNTESDARYSTVFDFAKYGDEDYNDEFEDEDEVEDEDELFATQMALLQASDLALGDTKVPSGMEIALQAFAAQPSSTPSSTLEPLTDSPFAPTATSIATSTMQRRFEAHGIDEDYDDVDMEDV